MTTNVIPDYPAPKRLATPSDLTDEQARVVTATINVLIADAFALYLKCKNYHWHLSGVHFRDLHLLFDEQAEQLLAMIDPLAERVRKIGGTTLRSIRHVGMLQRVQDDTDNLFSIPLEMLNHLMYDNGQFAARLREAHEVCDENRDYATAGLLEVFIDEAEKRTWFLFEAQQGATRTS
ncbi:Dps family protein [Deinococcus apachensis]|uniref:Dps family protein n=1 Tax=Deinococcus apachensis TaxID=309886 RepID=UPI0003624353|nr:DNA starvation/stationary phase protection protein [Deinococcus apachensis]